MSQFPFEKNELTPGISMENQLILEPMTMSYRN